MIEGTKMGAKDFETLYQYNYPRLKSFLDAMTLQETFSFLTTAMVDYVTLWKQSNDENALVVKLLESEPRELKKKEIQESWNYDIVYNSPWACNAEIETEHFQVTQVCL